MALLVAGDGAVSRARTSVSGAGRGLLPRAPRLQPLLPATGVSSVGLRGGTDTFVPRSALRPRPRQCADRGPARGFAFSGPPQPPPAPPGAAPLLGSCEAVSPETRPRSACSSVARGRRTPVSFLPRPRPACPCCPPRGCWGRSVCFLICESSPSSSWAALPAGRHQDNSTEMNSRQEITWTNHVILMGKDFLSHHQLLNPAPDLSRRASACCGTAGPRPLPRRLPHSADLPAIKAPVDVV